MGCDMHMFVEKKNQDGFWDVVQGSNSSIHRYRMLAKKARTKGDHKLADHFEKEANEIETGKSLIEALYELELNYPKDERDEDGDLQHEYDRERAYTLACHAPKVEENWVYDGRDYNVFAILAGVRNGGFFTPIVPTRGLPQDISPFVKQKADDWNSDAHHHSYLTVKELIEFDWNESYQQGAGEFYTETLPALKNLAKDQPKDVRIVFWFDN